MTWHDITARLSELGYRQVEVRSGCPPVDDLAALAAQHAAVRELRAAATPHERG